MAEKRVSVRLVVEGGKIVKAELKGLGDTGQTSFKQIERQADVTGRVVRRVMGVLAAAVSVRNIVSYADTWTDLRSRVDLATGSQERGAAVMGRLSEMARRTYSSLGQTAELWLSNATALRELGMSTQASLDFTEALNNAMVVSGARAERAEQVQSALSKAMALGALRGENLETVMTKGGRVAELLAESLGVNVNQLRTLGQQGKITGEVIDRSLRGNLELLREEADSMPATIGDAFTLMGNAALRLVGIWDALLGSSSSVAESIIFLSDNLERAAAYAIALGGVLAGRWVVSFVAARVATLGLSGALALLRQALIRTGIGAIVVAAGELIYQFGRLVRAAGGFGAALDVVKAVGIEVFQRIWDAGTGLQIGLTGVAWGIKASFLEALLDIEERFAKFSEAVAGFFNSFAPALGMPVVNPYLIADPEALRNDIAGARMVEQDSASMAKGYFDAAFAPLSSLPKLGELADGVDLSGDGGAGGGGSGAAGGRGRAKEDPYEKIIKNAKAFISTQEMERAALGMTEEAAAALRFEHEMLNRALDAGVKLTVEQRAEIGTFAKSMAAAQLETTELAKRLDGIKQAAGSVRTSLADAFTDVVTRVKSATSAVSEFLGQLGRLAINNAALNIMGNIGGSGPLGQILGGLFAPPAYATGTAFHPGGWARINERGGEIVNLPRGTQVIPHDLSRRMVAGGGGTQEVRVHVTTGVSVDRNGSLLPFVQDVAVTNARAVVDAEVKGIRETFGQSVHQAVTDPRMRRAR